MISQFQEWTINTYVGAQSTQALKQVVSWKIMRLSPSTNKVYDSGEATTLVDECGKMWGAFC